MSSATRFEDPRAPELPTVSTEQMGADATASTAAFAHRALADIAALRTLAAERHERINALSSAFEAMSERAEHAEAKAERLLAAIDAAAGKLNKALEELEAQAAENARLENVRRSLVAALDAAGVPLPDEDERPQGCRYRREES